MWALTWRSIVFLPAMLLVFVLQLALGACLLELPLVGAFYIYDGERQEGMVTLAVWLMLLWAWWRFKLWRLYV